MYTDKDKEREKTRERVRRYRQKKQAEQEGVTPVTVTNVTPLVKHNQDVTSSNKMVCKCQYFRREGDQLVCVQCGRIAPKKPEDKIKRGIQIK